METAQRERLLDPSEAMSQLCRKRSAFLSDRASGLVTPPVSLGTRKDGRTTKDAYPESEIQAIVRARIAGKSEDEIRKLVRDLVAARTKKVA